ncbi:MAG: OmpA family protein [Gammaproteobacteria bacterium]
MKLILCTLIALPFVCAANEMTPAPPTATIPAMPSKLATARGESQVSVYFSIDSAELSGAAKSALIPLIMKHRYSAIHEFLLSGHTDSTGPRDYNMLLSMRRVDAVKSYLIEQGVRPASIDSRTYGEARAAINIRDSHALILDRRVIVTIDTKPRVSQQFAVKGS